MIKSGTIPVFDKNNVSAYIPICDSAFKVCGKYVLPKIEERPFHFAVESSKIVVMFCFSTHAYNSLPKQPSRYISNL